jgi:hypothetical protein
MGHMRASHWRNPPIDNGTRHDSPVPDLAKYECPESDGEYRHRMMLNAIVFVFTSLLVLAGVWIATHMIVHAYGGSARDRADRKCLHLVAGRSAYFFASP